MGTRRDIISEFRNIHGDKYEYFDEESLGSKE
jgi:hypothetical protein